MRIPADGIQGVPIAAQVRSVGKGVGGTGGETLCPVHGYPFICGDASGEDR